MSAMLMGLVTQKARGHVFQVLFGSASLVAILRLAALLCLKCPWWGHSEAVAASDCSGKGWAQPLCQFQLRIGDPQHCLWWSFSGNHVSRCCLHTLLPLPLNAMEKRLCVTQTLFGVVMWRWILGAAPSLMHVAIKPLASEDPLWLQPIWQPGSGSGLI